MNTCLEHLRQAGFAAHPVGGCVRDTLLGRTPGDWDVTTSARPEAILALFDHAIPTGGHHGTVTVILEGGKVEVTPFREEGDYTDGRHPDRVEFVESLESDLSRRDFTINAMAFGPGETVIDRFGGREDLDRRLIRCVGEPERRFTEDALRILRAVRFAAQLDFVIEEETAAAMEACKEGISQVSAERVTAELEKTLLSPHPAWVGEFFRLGVMERFECCTLYADWSKLETLETESGPRWRGLCALTGLDVARLPVSRAVKRAVLRPHEGLEKTLALSGGDLMALGFRGAEIGAAQKSLVNYVLAHPEKNTPEELTIYLKQQTG